MFIIPIQDKKVKSHQVTALHLFVLFLLIAISSITIFVVKVVDDNSNSLLGNSLDKTITLVGSLILAVSVLLLILVLIKNKKIIELGWLNRIVRIVELIVLLLFFIAAVDVQNISLMILLGVATVGILYALYVEQPQKKNEQLVIDEKGIKLPGNLLKPQLKWSEIERVLLRHGTLTIDRTDKKRYQWLTINEVADDALEKFAQDQIDAHKSQRKSDW